MSRCQLFVERGAWRSVTAPVPALAPGLPAPCVMDASGTAAPRFALKIVLAKHSCNRVPLPPSPMPNPHTAHCCPNPADGIPPHLSLLTALRVLSFDGCLIQDGDLPLVSWEREQTATPQLCACHTAALSTACSAACRVHIRISGGPPACSPVHADAPGLPQPQQPPPARAARQGDHTAAHQGGCGAGAQRRPFRPSFARMSRLHHHTGTCTSTLCLLHLNPPPPPHRPPHVPLAAAPVP